MKRRLLCFLLSLVLAVPLAVGAAQRPQAAAPADWSSAYRTFVLENDYLREDRTWSGAPAFALHDLDGDGTPELLARNNATDPSARTSYVYTASDAGLRYAGNTGFRGAADHFAPGSGYPGLYCLEDTGGTLRGTYYALDNGVVTAQPVLTILRPAGQSSLFPCTITQDTRDNDLLAVFLPQAASARGQASGTVLTYRTVPEIRAMGWDAFAAEALQGDNTLFRDVSLGHWAWPYARFVCDRGLMTGTGQRVFSPDLLLSRAQVVTILHRLDGAPNAGGELPFSDADADAWYAPALRWAVQAELLTPVEEGPFLPDQNVERQELALLLYRYAHYKHVNTPAAVAIFSDWDQVRDDCVEAMYWAVGAGLINGTGDGSLTPSGTVTRAQLAAVLQRFCENVLEK